MFLVLPGELKVLPSSFSSACSPPFRAFVDIMSPPDPNPTPTSDNHEHQQSFDPWNAEPNPLFGEFLDWTDQALLVPSQPPTMDANTIQYILPVSTPCSWNYGSSKSRKSHHVFSKSHSTTYDMHTPQGVDRRRSNRSPMANGLLT